METPPSTDSAPGPIALLFIHGIGVQDRYQQLVDFTSGLAETLQSDPSRAFDVCERDTEDMPRGRSIPLRITPRPDVPGCRAVDVDVYEVYWGPLLNGLTSPPGVLGWIWETVWRAIPWNRPTPAGDAGSTAGDAPRRTAGRAGWPKCLYEIGYVAVFTGLAALLLWWSAGALLLTAAALDPAHPARHVSLAAFWLTPLTAVWQGEHASLSQALQAWTHVKATLLSQTAGRLLIALLYLAGAFWSLKYAADGVGLAYRLIRSYRDARRRPHGDAVVRSIATHYDQRYLWSTLGWRVLATALLTPATLALAHWVDWPIARATLALALFLLLYRGMQAGLADVIGDVQVYVTRNENSKKFAGREAVLERSLAVIGQVLASPRYDTVYLAGHSLGSMIGLEAIRRLYTAYALQYAEPGAPGAAPPDGVTAYRKLKAFITFGSPLEKTRLFFYRDDYKSRFGEFSREVDRRIFLASDDCPGGAAEPLHTLTWFNFWIWTDVVCDPLSSYPVDRQHEVELPGHWNVWSHSDYWRDPLFVGNVLRILSWAPPRTISQLALSAAAQ